MCGLVAVRGAFSGCRACVVGAIKRGAPPWRLADHCSQAFTTWSLFSMALQTRRRLPARPKSPKTRRPPRTGRYVAIGWFCRWACARSVWVPNFQLTIVTAFPAAPVFFGNRSSSTDSSSLPNASSSSSDSPPPSSSSSRGGQVGGSATPAHDTGSPATDASSDGSNSDVFPAASASTDEMSVPSEVARRIASGAAGADGEPAATPGGLYYRGVAKVRLAGGPLSSLIVFALYGSMVTDPTCANNHART